MNRDELAEHVAVADDEARRLAPVLQVLRRHAERPERVQHVVVAELRVAVDDARRADPVVAAEADVGADGGVRADDRARAEDRRRVHDGGRVDGGGVVDHRHVQLGLGRHLAGHARHRREARDRRPGGAAARRRASPGRRA